MTSFFRHRQQSETECFFRKSVEKFVDLCYIELDKSEFVEKMMIDTNYSVEALEYLLDKECLIQANISMKQCRQLLNYFLSNF